MYINDFFIEAANIQLFLIERIYNTEIKLLYI
mgnify:CR=1 FL=1